MHIKLQVATQVAKDCQLLYGIADGEESQPNPDDGVRYKIVTILNCESGVVPTLIISLLDRVLIEVEWYVECYACMMGLCCG